jgi:hypothetical protein
MQADKNIYTFDDLVEILSEHAIGTEVMQKIETFCTHKQQHTAYLLRRLENAERWLGSNLLDEYME